MSASTERDAPAGEDRPVTELVERLGRRGRRAFVLFGALSALGALFDVDQFLRSWLLAFLFWLAFPLGSFVVTQIHHMTGGSWGQPAKRVLEGAARTIPLFLVLFLPIALGVRRLYPWADPEVVAHDALLQHKSAWLNVPFFLVRAVLYLAAWSIAVRLQDRLSRHRERDSDVRLVHKQRTWAAPATGLYALCMTFAAFDWAMSLEPHWFSSIYGVSFLVGQGLVGFAFSIVAAAILARRERHARWVGPEHFHDLGKLMFAFVLLWAYVSYSQYLLVWSGNLLEEVPWYRARTRGGWQGVALVLITLHFALPFLILLSRKVKRDPRALVVVAGSLLALRWVDLAWYVVPAFHPGELGLHWQDASVTLAMGGLWLAAFTRELQDRPLVAESALGRRAGVQEAAATP